jgi:hypothetical protein
MADVISTRRGILGAIAGVPVVAAFGTIPLPAFGGDWQATLASLTNAKAREESYDARVFAEVRRHPVGSVERNSAANAVPSKTWERSEALTDNRIAKEDAMIAAPAPHLSAVIYKIEYARERWAESEDWPADWWHSVMTDLRRLAGESR